MKVCGRLGDAQLVRHSRQRTVREQQLKDLQFPVGQRRQFRIGLQKGLKGLLCPFYVFKIRFAVYVCWMRKGL